jgi:hypothetical protein
LAPALGLSEWFMPFVELRLDPGGFDEPVPVVWLVPTVGLALTELLLLSVPPAAIPVDGHGCPLRPVRPLVPVDDDAPGDAGVPVPDGRLLPPGLAPMVEPLPLGLAPVARPPLLLLALPPAPPPEPPPD